MNTFKTICSLLITLLAGASCGTGNKPVPVSKILDNCPVVGNYVQTGNNRVLSCDLALFKDTIRLPLSFFTEEMEIIKLDDRDEALVKQASLTVSDNYILVSGGYPPQPFKLFDRKGNYISDIGGIGQGPGEYNNVYGAQIDETNNRIYLMPWQSAQLLVYDLEGKTLDPIPLCLRCPKSKFYVDAKAGTVSVVVLPFQGIPAVAWTQDLKGNRISYIEAGHLQAPQDFSNEVSANFNIPGVFDVNILCIMPTRVDSLYRYDIPNNRLQPTFTLNFPDTKNIPWHGYNEWPDYYTGDVSGPPVEVSPGNWTNGETAYYIVDKNTCKGSFFTMFNDFFGNLDIGWPAGAFSNGYYSRNVEPGNLLTDIEKALKNKNLTDEMRKKLTDLQNSIGENDNNYILLARLKK